MPTEATFRFSTYLTLALACVTLGYAQAPMLPEAAGFAALAVLALGALYFIETRFALLTIPAANRLGAVVVACFVLWGAYRVKREIDTGEFANLGWPMLMVAMFGPLVVMLLPAKVARGEKHAGDYWWLHGLALAGVGLAAAFAEEPLCFALVGLYLGAAVWSLSLFYLGRASGAVPPIPDPKAAPVPAAAASGEPLGTRTDFRSALVWAAVTGAVAVPVYLLTPRSLAPKADFGKPRVEIGYAADQMVDLNRTGALKTNSETAFEVTATYPDGKPKTDLNPDQRWRGRTHQQYANGAWNMEPKRLPNLVRTARQSTPWVAPDLGPGQFALAFDLPAKAKAYFVADPIIWLPNQPVPLAGVTDAGEHGWMPSPDGTFYWDPAQRARTRQLRYVQAYTVESDPDLGPGFQIVDSRLDDSLDQLRTNPVERVKEYADQLLADLIEAGKLPAEWRDPAKLRDPKRRLPRAEHHDLIARAFSAHLATTPTLRYTTDLKRTNAKIDPVEDFLFHSKAGHCERFATALVLMLRSQGIPAVFVLGFKGHEHAGDGKYLVKQEHAHAWAEAFVSVPIPAADRHPDGPTHLFHWRGLDPTPGGGDATDDANQDWWHKANSWVGTQFQHYVTDYTPEQRRKELAGFANRLTQVNTLLALVNVIVLAFSVRAVLRWRARRTGAAPAPQTPTRWFGELVTVLSAHGIAPGAGDTPMEFALGAADALRARAGCAGVAEVPIAWAGAYYQDRFGGAPPSDARLAELDHDLEQLRRALETRV
ncbi:transglutaminase domain-containing protein [Gemmata sp. G18]|uniref:Transglutaminase domain-containing protein n=1 Tax=Gemmata palustris TaxID=2822762 RepID=A0ABS5BTC7_9BACT|nr:transglutaminase domain-containing protein [Gemmata palustris]MBP3956113.1 transglutaminase domain-containing protein [Gemmata palustris]